MWPLFELESDHLGGGGAKHEWYFRLIATSVVSRAPNLPIRPCGGHSFSGFLFGRR